MNFITNILFPCVVNQLSHFLILCLPTLWIESCFSQTCCSQRHVVIRLELKLCCWHELQCVFIINTENPVMLWACWIRGEIKGILPVKALVKSYQFILHWMTTCHWFLKQSRQLPSLYWTSLAALNLHSVANLLYVQTPLELPMRGTLSYTAISLNVLSVHLLDASISGEGIYW